MTLGPDGCYVAGAELEGEVPAFPVRAVDGTGAGDAFAAGILSGRLAGRGLLVDAALFANAAGALATTAVGATEGLRPRRDPRIRGSRGGGVSLRTSAASSRRVRARLNRLFAADGPVLRRRRRPRPLRRGTFFAGIEAMEWAIATLVEAGPDAIQLSPGQAPYLQRLQGPQKPALVLRTDVANVREQTPRHLFSELVAGAVELALRLDAACVVCNLLQLPDQPELFHQCVQNVSALRAACDPVGMPLMVEPLVMQPSEQGPTRRRRRGEDRPLVRQAVELGADVIKADPTDDLDDYARVIEIAGEVPVLVRRRSSVRRDDLDRTEAVMAQGAAGIVYGRNVVQHADPAAMIRP